MQFSLPAFFAFMIIVIVGALLPGLASSAVQKKASVVVSKTQLQKFSDEVQYPARVKSKINAWVVSESLGEIKKILKPIGSAVMKGETVLIIQNTDPVYRYSPVKIVSPARGYITSMETELFNRVERGQKLFSVTDPANLVVEIEIPSADLHFFKIGQKAELKDQSGQKFSLLMTALSPAVNVQTGTASAELIIQNDAAHKLKQGQIGQVIFYVNQRSSFVVPESALIYRDKMTFVRVLENNKVKRLPVQIAANLGDKVEIMQGLKEGQQLIERWSRFIADNEEVEIQQNNPESKKE